MKQQHTRQCPDQMTLENFLAQKLSSDRQPKIIFHLMRCSACRKKLDEIRKEKFHLNIKKQIQDITVSSEKVLTHSSRRYTILIVLSILIPIIAMIFFAIISINTKTASLLIKRAEAGKTEDRLRMIHKAILLWVAQPRNPDAPLFPENLEELVKERFIKYEMLLDPVSGLPIEYFPIISEEDFQQNPPILRSRVGEKYCIMYAKGNISWEDVKMGK